MRFAHFAKAGAVTLSDLMGPRLGLGCARRQRKGRYSVARLMAKHGDALLTDLRAFCHGAHRDTLCGGAEHRLCCICKTGDESRRRAWAICFRASAYLVNSSATHCRAALSSQALIAF
jgi:hypothetical protein